MSLSRQAEESGSYDIYSRLLKGPNHFPWEKRSMRLTASLVVAQLLFLESEDPGKDIQSVHQQPGWIWLLQVLRFTIR